ncbi:MAG: hypothetical protein EOM83_14055 [Clostridia bacterium]|nr:hypothetical protein [Clostridia bacterium]
MRVPGDFLNQFIFMLPVQLCVYNNDLKSAAYLSVSFSVVSACAIPLKPISTILLVRVAMANFNQEKNRISLLYYCLVSLVLTLIYRCFTWVFNEFYFKNEDFLYILNALTPLVFFYSVYVLSRSYVDALFSGPMLTYVNLIALFFGYIVFWFLFPDPWVIALVSYGFATIIVIFLVSVKKHA